MPAPSCRWPTARLRIDKEGKVKKIVDEVEHVSFSGKRAVAQGQDITYVTERCVMKLTPDGLLVTEIAPGVDLERDVLAQADIPLAVAQRPQGHAGAPLSRRADRPVARMERRMAERLAEQLVTFEQDGAVGTITLRRPEKFNALDIPMLQALDAALDEAEAAERRPRRAARAARARASAPAATSTPGRR